MIGYYVIIGLFALFGWLVSSRLKSKFAKYAQVPTRAGMSGEEVAYAMLRHYGVSGVRVVMGQGMLTDHYNPTNKTVSLSPDVFQGRTVAAAAVSAHEVGHAIQHDKAYAMLGFRSKIVPMVNISSRIQQFLFMGFMFGLAASPFLGQIFMLALVVTFGITALFSLVTLPVEFDASRRALVWLDETGVAEGAEYEGAKDALWWAAMTYVVSALSALTMFLYFLMQYLGSRN
jgi:uncharacterized protein